MSTKPIVVFYHKECLDGFGAAWAAWRKFGARADYIAIEPVPRDAPALSGKEIYFLDAGFDARQRHTLRALTTRNKKVLLIDHHLTRQSALPLYSAHHFNLHKSGANLSWEYFHSSKKLPRLLAYIEDVDLWRFALPHSKALSAFLETCLFEFKTFNALAASFENPAKRKEYIREGKTIMRYKETMLQELMRGARAVSFAGHHALAVESSQRFLRSEIGHRMAERRGFSVGIVWFFEGNGDIRVSLRSRKNVDVAKIAARFGGGGHAQAAGFRLVFKNISSFPWKPLTK